MPACVQVAHYLGASIAPWADRLWACSSAAASCSASDPHNTNAAPGSSTHQNGSTDLLPERTVFNALDALQHELGQQVLARHPVLLCEHLTAPQKLHVCPRELQALALFSCTFTGCPASTVHVECNIGALSTQSRAAAARRTAVKASKAGKRALRAAVCATSGAAGKDLWGRHEERLQSVADVAALRRTHCAMPDPPEVSVHVHNGGRILQRFPLPYAARSLRDSICGEAVTSLSYNVPVHSYACKRKNYLWLAGVIRHLPRLTKLTVNSEPGCDFVRVGRWRETVQAVASGMADDHLFVAIASSKELKHLSMGELDMEQMPCSTTPTWYSSFKHLTRLDMHCATSESFNAHCVAGILPQLCACTMQGLCISSPSSMLPCDLQHVRKLTALTQLHLQSNTINVRSLQLSSMQLLQSAELYGRLWEEQNMVSSSDLRHIGETLAQLPKLRHVGMYAHARGRLAALPPLAVILAPLRRAKLTSLSLPVSASKATSSAAASTVVGLPSQPAAIASLASTVGSMRYLRRLHVFANFICCGDGAVAAELAALPHFRDLTVRGSGEGIEGSCTLGSALAKVTRLTSLHVKPELAEASVRDIASALPALSQLQRLHLTGLPEPRLAASTAVVGLIGCALTQLTALRTLSCETRWVSQEESVTLCAALAVFVTCMPALTCLRLPCSCSELRQNDEGRKLLQAVQRATGRQPEAVLAPASGTGFELHCLQRGQGLPSAANA